PSNLPVHSLCVGLPSLSVPSMVTFTWSPAASYTTVVFFPSPGVSFDLLSFNFHVPICGSSAAKHAAPAKKQSARVNPIVFIFMPPPSTHFQIPSMLLFKLTSGKRLHQRL